MTQPRGLLCLAVFVATLLVVRPALVRGQSGTTVVITPGAPVPVTSPRVTVNNGPGDQTDPHVSGDLAAYTDVPSSSIRYYRFSTGVDTTITLNPTATWIWAPGITGSTPSAEFDQLFFSKSISLATAASAATIGDFVLN